MDRPIRIIDRGVSKITEMIVEELIIPDHVALICDGNRRWAKKKGVKIKESYREGLERIKELSRYLRSIGVSTLTLWGFSTENWKRSEGEIFSVMEVAIQAVVELERELHEDQVKFIHLGRKDRLPRELRRKLESLERSTESYRKFYLNLAFDYGGRDEIIRAVKKILKRGISPEELNEELFSCFLDTAEQPHPDPDLIIRTSGEHRTSGFLPWQSVYSELFFVPKFLPDFTVEGCRAILEEYSKRQRRFGR